jgi:hypothetical protein
MLQVEESEEKLLIRQLEKSTGACDNACFLKKMEWQC